MENSNPLATESFSYSWLANKKTSSSPNQSTNDQKEQQKFKFDIPITNSHNTLVHADEIFSNGHIMPVYVHNRRTTTTTAASVPSSPVIIITSKTQLINIDHHHKKGSTQFFFFKKWRKNMLQKLCETMGCSRKSNRVDDLKRKVCEIRQCSPPRISSAHSVVEPSATSSHDVKMKKVKSCSSSPRISTSYRSSNVGCDDVSSTSINEAILYCKRSIGMVED